MDSWTRQLNNINHNEETGTSNGLVNGLVPEYLNYYLRDSVVPFPRTNYLYLMIFTVYK